MRVAWPKQAIAYIIPALLHIKTNGGEVRRARAMWKKGSAEYIPALGKRVWAMRNVYMPIFMLVFGVVAMVAGVATAVVWELTPTKA